MKNVIQKSVLLSFMFALFSSMIVFAEDEPVAEPCNHNFEVIRQGAENTDEYESSFRVEKCTLCGVERAVSGICKKTPDNIEETTEPKVSNCNISNDEFSVGTVESKGKNIKKIVISDMTYRKVSEDEVELIKVTSNSSNVYVPNFVTDSNNNSYYVIGICKNAFKGSKVKRIEVGEKVVNIKAGAFSGAKKLRTIVLHSEFTKLPKGIFKGCDNVKCVAFICSNLSSVGKNSLVGLSDKVEICVPFGEISKYKKLFKNKMPKNSKFHYTEV